MGLVLVLVRVIIIVRIGVFVSFRVLGLGVKE